MSMADPTAARVHRVAREVFGHDSLLDGQEEAVAALLDGHDVLLVLPTGGGKSLAYQLPAVLLDGDGEVLTVLFEAAGYRTLSVAVVREQGLLVLA